MFHVKVSESRPRFEKGLVRFLSRYFREKPLENEKKFEKKVIWKKNSLNLFQKPPKSGEYYNEPFQNQHAIHHLTKLLLFDV